MKHSHIIPATCLMAAMALAACSDDNEVMNSNRVRVNVLPCISSVEDTGISTRALISGYHKFAPLGIESIGLNFATVKDTGEELGEGFSNFVYSDGTWSSDMELINQTKYAVYGSMPYVSGATITLPSGDETNYVLTLPGMKPGTAVDVCSVVGVKKAEGANPAIEDSGIKLGAFGYESNEDAKQANALFLLMDHLYAAIDFKFKIDEGYNKYRDIKIKSVAIASKGKEATTVVKFLPNTTGTNPITEATTTYGSSASTSSSEKMFEAKSASDVKLLSKDGNLICTGYIAPADAETLSGLDNVFTITTTFDVYDKGNEEKDIDPVCVRSGATATNKLKVSQFSKLERGKKYTINATVIPTYLYQLSDNDLNNPSVSFE